MSLLLLDLHIAGNVLVLSFVVSVQYCTGLFLLYPAGQAHITH